MLGRPSRLIIISGILAVAFGVATPPVHAETATAYQGPHSEWVHKLLERAGPWTCPLPGDAPGGNPEVEANFCQRDGYVAAALAYAWAAECYARNEENTNAVEQAKRMREELLQSEELCSVCDADLKQKYGKIPDGYQCGTDALFGCCEIIGGKTGGVPVFGAPEDSKPDERRAAPPREPRTKEEEPSRCPAGQSCVTLFN